MPTMGEKLWEVAKSPPQNLTLVVFGLFAILAGFILRTYGAFIVGTAAVGFTAAAIGGIGAFFVTVALFLGAFAGVGDSDHVALRIAALISAIVVLIILL